MKTIKDIAEQVGVSKTAIYALIKNHKIPTIKKDGLTYVDERGLNLIRMHYENARHETVIDMIQDSINVDSQLENRQIISLLEKQLDEKQEIIRGLLQALESEQQLRAVPLLLEKQVVASNDSTPLKKNFWERFKF